MSSGRGSRGAEGRPPAGPPRGSEGAGAVRTVAFRTLGCRLNQCETAQMEEALAGDGYEAVPWDDRAAVRVLNTCTVTAKTDRECRREIRRAKRNDPESIVAVTGCYAQVAPEKVAEVPGVDIVLGNLEKSRLAEHLQQAVDRGNEAGGAARSECGSDAPGSPAVAVGGYGPDVDFGAEPITYFSGYTRAFLKVQNGCDASCAYCVIPAARGPSRSMARSDAVSQVRVLAREGFREIVLTGIHLGAWGMDTGEGRLSDLLEGLLAVEEMGRFRVSSIEPMEVDDDLLAVARCGGDRFAPHFHLPLQSGSDSVLRRMNRPYRRDEFAERVERVREAFPDAAIGTDVIVGFPGETEAEFEDTEEFIASVPVTYLHVFSYSDRPGTHAAAMPGKVSGDVIRERSARLRGLGETKRVEFERQFTGRDLPALLLRQTDEQGRRVGITGNYMEVVVDGRDAVPNELVWVRPVEREEEGRWVAESSPQERVCAR